MCVFITQTRESLCLFFSSSYRDLSSNSLSGPIPTSLLQKSQDGTQTLRFARSPPFCQYICKYVEKIETLLLH